MADIPNYLVEQFLLGRTRDAAEDRFLTDGGIVSDVWAVFARDLGEAQRVLVAPMEGVRSVELGYALNKAIRLSRAARTGRGSRKAKQAPSPQVAPLESFVAMTLTLDDLLRIVLRMTRWWRDRGLARLRDDRQLAATLHRLILIRLGGASDDDMSATRKELQQGEKGKADRKLIDAASVAALIGLFRFAESRPESLEPARGLNPRNSDDTMKLMKWIAEHADTIADAALDELSAADDAAFAVLREDMASRGGDPKLWGDEADGPPTLALRVFRDREAQTADFEGNTTIKADAAQRLFAISCKSVTWAIIDSGIATTHPAFYDHGAKATDGRKPSRVSETYDFTLVDEIRNFDLVAEEGETKERDALIEEIIGRLLALPGRDREKGFREKARKLLKRIAEQLEELVQPDWSLIRPLIRLPGDDGATLTSDHGTHVAGILGGDWRSDSDPDADPILRGVCPDIKLFDLRVIDKSDFIKGTEFALLAALEFVQYVNERTSTAGPVIHGVNISMSIPYNVRTYGCGATPVCVATDRLAKSGVVVVAAAGNRGWDEQEMGFGSFVPSSITDPGNAREVITVGSTHRARPHAHGISYFSSRGPTGDGRAKPDVVAPGEKIQGPVRGDADGELSGTSMAAPFVSGAAAMLLARNHELIGNSAEVKRILCETATDLGREKHFQGHGLVDVLRALQSI